MGNLSSPGISIKEVDLTNITINQSGVTGAFVGLFEWGEVGEPTYISNEGDLLKMFGKPLVGYNRRDWFVAAKFLEYSNNMYVLRVVNDLDRNAISGYDEDNVTSSNTIIRNRNEFSFGFTNPDDAVFAAKWVGELGNNLKVTIIDKDTFDNSPHKNLFSGKPTDTECHVVIEDIVTNEILEIFDYLNFEPGKLKLDGTISYIVDVLNNESFYVWLLKDISSAGEYTFSYGVLTRDKNALNKAAGYDYFLDKDSYDVSLIIAGEDDDNHIINQKVLDVASKRRDSTGFVSPRFASVKNGSSSTTLSAIIDDREALSGDSYGFFDSNWGYVFDKYNKRFLWIPMNPIVAGLVARTEIEREAWFAPAGYNRGIIKGVNRLAWAQNNAIRDALYKKQINPITTFKGEGIVLFGQKTLQTKPSAFDRLNVRRLFILIEKSIERSAKYKLFEMNNQQTRLLFTVEINQFLRNIQAGQGVYDFLVICDETNNPPQVTDSNSFVCDIYIKPSRSSIEFINLNFVATPTGLSFEETMGK